MDSDKVLPSSTDDMIDSIIRKSSSQLIDPIPDRDLPREGPHHSIRHQVHDAIKRLFRLRRERLTDKHVWKNHVDDMVQKFRNKFPNGKITKGTFLYHGSLNPNLDFGIEKQEEDDEDSDSHDAAAASAEDDEDDEFTSIRKLLHERFQDKELENLRDVISDGKIFKRKETGRPVGKKKKTKKAKKKESPMFFGLEPSISVWYIYELIEQIRFRAEKGYLYVLKVTQDIPITQIIDQLIHHPTEFSECWKEKKGVCVHPQLIFHGDSDGVRDLGIEVTIRPSEFKEHLQLMTVDPIWIEKKNFN